MQAPSPTEGHRAPFDQFDENYSEASCPPPESLKLDDIAKMQHDLKDTKTKLRAITQKFSTIRKERDGLKKENKDLQNEIMTLQSSIREMIPGFSNTSSMYPMHNELIVIISDFMKCSCVDIFFDILSQELSMDGVVFFFKTAMELVHKHVSKYFDPVFATLLKTTCCDKIEGPLLNVLRKVYQNSWKKVFGNCISQAIVDEIVAAIQAKLSLGEGRRNVNRDLGEFIKKLCEVYFVSYISEPEFIWAYDMIGSKVQFNALKHECMDGFLKVKEESVIILPIVFKNKVNGEIITKAHVLPVSYHLA